MLTATETNEAAREATSADHKPLVGLFTKQVSADIPLWIFEVSAIGLGVHLIIIEKHIIIGFCLVVLGGVVDTWREFRFRSQGEIE